MERRIIEFGWREKDWELIPPRLVGEGDMGVR